MFLGCATIMVKLIFGEHCLRVNSGRTENISRNLRLCTMCSQGQIEDLKHFILYCSQYDQVRQRLFDEVSKIMPSFRRLSYDQKLFLVFGGTRTDLEYHSREKIMKSSCLSRAFMYKIRVASERSRQLQ